MPEVRNLVTWGSFCSCGSQTCCQRLARAPPAPLPGCALPPAPPLPCSPPFQTSPSTAAGGCPTPGELHGAARAITHAARRCSPESKCAELPGCIRACVSPCPHHCKLGIDLGEPQHCKRGAQEGVRRGERAGLGGKGRLASQHAACRGRAQVTAVPLARTEGPAQVGSLLEGDVRSPAGLLQRGKPLVCARNLCGASQIIAVMEKQPLLGPSEKKTN